MLLAGAAGLAALGPLLLATATPAAAFTTGVNIEDKPRPDPNGDGLFNPGTTTINVGSKVLWTNKTSNRHTVTSDPGAVEFDSGDLRGPGGQFEFRFDTVGTFTYRCTRHPKMVGRVQVVDPNAPTTTTTTAPVTTTTAAPVTTTTAPATTTTAAPTTTTTEPRPASGVVPPPTAAASPPPPSTTTSVPSTTTTTTAPPTTPTSAAPALAGGDEGTLPPPSSAPPSTATTQASTDKTSQAAGPPVSSDGKLDVGAVVLVAALVAVGAFGAWTLIRVRPGRI
ncbi:MAG TPA: plastocyanin/azurin family copper-binding protein [Acidimicrobiia bacterium]|nr:plastocyanin/azurin family copper-binding protein [Acidimicrobiia bacterium]